MEQDLNTAKQAIMAVAIKEIFFLRDLESMEEYQSIAKLNSTLHESKTVRSFLFRGMIYPPVMKKAKAIETLHLHHNLVPRMKVVLKKTDEFINLQIENYISALLNLVENHADLKFMLPPMLFSIIVNKSANSDNWLLKRDPQEKATITEAERSAFYKMNETTIEMLKELLINNLLCKGI